MLDDGQLGVPFHDAYGFRCGEATESPWILARRTKSLLSVSSSPLAASSSLKIEVWCSVGDATACLTGDDRLVSHCVCGAFFFFFLWVSAFPYNPSRSIRVEDRTGLNGVSKRLHLFLSQARYAFLKC